MDPHPSSRVVKWSDVPTWLKLIVVVAMINFFAFILVDVKLGGDALNGYQKEGRFYLCDHGAYTEVSRAVWTYSYWHAISVFITHSSAFIGTAIAIWLAARVKRRSA